MQKVVTKMQPIYCCAFDRCSKRYSLGRHATTMVYEILIVLGGIRGLTKIQKYGNKNPGTKILKI
jgi:hypothetical protein